MLKNPNQKVIKRMAGNALKVNRRKTITLFFAVLPKKESELFVPVILICRHSMPRMHSAILA